MIPAVVLIGLDVYQIAVNVPELRQSQDLVTHTIEVITETQVLETAIRDTERDQRGFLITGGCSLSGSLQIGGGAGSRHPFKAKAAHRRQSRTATPLADFRTADKCQASSLSDWS